MEKPVEGRDLSYTGVAEAGTQKRPRSATHPSTTLAGLIGLAFALWATVSAFPDSDPAWRAVLVCVAIAVPMIVVECLVHRTHGSFVDSEVAAFDPGRVAVKLVGIYAICAAIVFLYWLLPLYGNTFYAPYFDVLKSVGLWLALLGIPYTLWVDRRMHEPFDSYWHAGMWMLGNWHIADGCRVGQFVRGWLIKGFFLPLMFVLLVNTLSSTATALGTGAFFDAIQRHEFLIGLAFLVDLTFACIGYTLTTRVLDTHIRSAEPTLLGWLVTLVCYQPLWGLVSGDYLAYNADGIGWRNGLPDLEWLHWVWSATILTLTAIYAWSTAAFGLRFSNLTHRGIITSGPYRFTKHPAYLTKNISWWLIAVPFISNGSWQDALRNCLLLLLVNTLYYLRARTEERHLAQDPVYVQYALWMETHGLLRFAGRLFPRVFAFRWRDPGQARAALGWEEIDNRHSRESGTKAPWRVEQPKAGPKGEADL